MMPWAPLSVLEWGKTLYSPIFWPILDGSALFRWFHFKITLAVCTGGEKKLKPDITKVGALSNSLANGWNHEGTYRAALVLLWHEHVGKGSLATCYTWSTLPRTGPTGSSNENANNMQAGMSASVHSGMYAQVLIGFWGLVLWRSKVWSSSSSRW